VGIKPLSGTLKKYWAFYLILSLYSVFFCNLVALVAAGLNIYSMNYKTQLFWTDIEIFIISTFTSILILIESFRWRKKKPLSVAFNPLNDQSVEESNPEAEKDLRFKALENIINRVWGENAMSKTLSDLQTPLKREKLSEYGEKGKLFTD